MRLIREDVPFFDLTTLLLGIGKKYGRMVFSARHDMMVCGIEEASKVVEQTGSAVIHAVESGTLLSAETIFLEAEGTAQSLHIAWKVALNILEYTSGIATRTWEMVDAARCINPLISIVTTRKTFPGTKALAIKAVLAGGGLPHRLGLSETVLIFPQHLAFMGDAGTVGFDVCCQMLDTMRQHAREKKICMEVEDREGAVLAARSGVDIIQIDKMAVAELRETVDAIRSIAPHIAIAIAGGITSANVAVYAATGVDLIVTTFPYFGKPADIAVKMIQG